MVMKITAAGKRKKEAEAKKSRYVARKRPGYGKGPGHKPGTDRQTAPASGDSPHPNSAWKPTKSKPSSGPGKGPSTRKKPGLIKGKPIPGLKPSPRPKPKPPGKPPARPGKPPARPSKPPAGPGSRIRPGSPSRNFPKPQRIGTSSDKPKPKPTAGKGSATKGQRGYGKGPGGSRVPPTRVQDAAKGPKKARNITGVARSHRGKR